MRDKLLILVVPPQLGLLEGFANGVISLANYLEGRLPSVAVQLLDLSLSSPPAVEDAIAACLGGAQDQAVLVGVTTTTATYQSALQVACVFKRKRRDTFVIFGGHHASVQAEVILAAHPTLIDVVVRGEGELPLAQILMRYPRMGTVSGISYVDDAGRIRHNSSPPLLDESELDKIAPTRRAESIRAMPGKFHRTTYVSARGCPLHCAFCSVANQSIRAKSVGAVIADLRHLVGDLGFKQIAIEDNFFAHSRSRTLELCAAIARLQQELPFSWDCQTRVESMARPDILEALEAAGCDAVYLGVEALNAPQLLYLGKTRNPDAYMRTLRQTVAPRLMRSKMQCYINLQLAIPGEGEGARQAMLQSLAELGAIAAAQGREIVVFPQLNVQYPGTQHFDEAVAAGVYGANGKSAFEEFTRWEMQQNPILTWLGDHFAHGVGGIPIGILRADHLKQGVFEADLNAILTVVSTLSEMERIAGVRVFRYGEHLARQEDCEVPAPSLYVVNGRGD